MTARPAQAAEAMPGSAAAAAMHDAQELLKRFSPSEANDRALRGARFDVGLAFPHFDAGFGGRGLEPAMQDVIEQLFLRAGCVNWRNRNIIGLGMAAPTIYDHGTL